MTSGPHCHQLAAPDWSVNWEQRLAQPAPARGSVCLQLQEQVWHELEDPACRRYLLAVFKCSPESLGIATEPGGRPAGGCTIELGVTVPTGDCATKLGGTVSVGSCATEHGEKISMTISVNTSACSI